MHMHVCLMHIHVYIQVSELCFRHARASVLSYVQLAVFCNLFLFHVYSCIHECLMHIHVYLQVSELYSWHARAAVLSYVQLAVFCNLFVLQSSDDAVRQLRQLVLRLLSDDQLEVTRFHCRYNETVFTKMFPAFSL